MTKMQKPFNQTSGWIKGCFVGGVVGGCVVPILFWLVMALMALSNDSYTGSLWMLPFSLFALDGGFIVLIFTILILAAIGGAIGALIAKILEWLSY